MSPEDRRRFVQIVGQVLIADGALGDDEREYLDRVMDELELSPEERKAALSGIDLDSPVEERVRALSPEARPKLVETIEKAAAIDGSSHRAESELIATIRELVAKA